MYVKKAYNSRVVWFYQAQNLPNGHHSKHETTLSQWLAQLVQHYFWYRTIPDYNSLLAGSILAYK